METGWLLDDGTRCVGTCGEYFALVTYTDANALRFVREWDAENFRHVLLWMPKWRFIADATRPVEHSWG
jgi:hypothetical protein